MTGCLLQLAGVSVFCAPFVAVCRCRHGRRFGLLPFIYMTPNRHAPVGWHWWRVFGVTLLVWRVICLFACRMRHRHWVLLAREMFRLARRAHAGRRVHLHMPAAKRAACEHHKSHTCLCACVLMHACIRAAWFFCLHGHFSRYQSFRKVGYWCACLRVPAVVQQSGIPVIPPAAECVL